ncbi:MAG: hypothetical protein H9855_00995 [Candidatus Acinetobacter avistercoris]|nr:hypothetical protein [Candidatus Acinetobacter avistercoris]
MNFNLNLQVDKVMNKLSESKTLRIWTYMVGLGFILGLLIWQAAPIITAVASLLTVLN